MISDNNKTKIHTIYQRQFWFSSFEAFLMRLKKTDVRDEKFNSSHFNELKSHHLEIAFLIRKL